MGMSEIPKPSEQVLSHITEGVAGATGQEFFRSLVKHLAQALAVHYAFITECIDPPQSSVRALAFWDGAGFAHDFEYPLRGTPCEKVIEGHICLHPERLQQLFPEDTDLARLGAESYAGVPLPDSHGKVLGHLVVMDDKPMDDPPPGLSVLKVFAARAGAELERVKAEESLQAEDEGLEFQRFLAEAPGFGDLVFGLDVDERRAISPQPTSPPKARR